MNYLTDKERAAAFIAYGTIMLEFRVSKCELDSIIAQAEPTPMRKKFFAICASTGMPENRVMEVVRLLNDESANLPRNPLQVLLSISQLVSRDNNAFFTGATAITQEGLLRAPEQSAKTWEQIHELLYRTVLPDVWGHLTDRQKQILRLFTNNPDIVP